MVHEIDALWLINSYSTREDLFFIQYENMDLIYIILSIIIIIAILLFIYKNICIKNDEDFEYDGSSSTKIRHGNL